MREYISKIKLDHNKTYRFISEIFHDEIYIYYYQGAFNAISGFCPHFGGPLTLKDNTLFCYWHGWKFNAKSHTCINHNINLTIRSYNIKEVENFLVISDDN
jgi:nitrite reductase/ring-hydroxylating ferredoxin subunit